MSAMNFGNDDTIDMDELARQQEKSNSSSASAKPKKSKKPREPSSSSTTVSSSSTETPPRTPFSNSSSSSIATTYQSSSSSSSSFLPKKPLSTSSSAKYSSSKASHTELKIHTRARTQTTFDKEHAYHDNTLPANFDFNALNHLLIYRSVKVKDVKRHTWLTRIIWGRHRHYQRSRPTIPMALNDEIRRQIINDCHLSAPQAKHFSSKQAVIIACVEFLHSRQVQDAYIDGMPDKSRINHVIQYHYDNSRKEFDMKDLLTNMRDNQKEIMERQGIARSKSKWQFRLLKHIGLGILSILSILLKPANHRQQINFNDKNDIQGALTTDKYTNRINDAAVDAGKTQSKRMYEQKYGHTAR